MNDIIHPNTLSQLEVSVVMPCLNEARTLPPCIAKALSCLRENGIKGEVLIADNGSDDGSAQIAQELGARVITVPEKGYGAALYGGIKAARGRFVIIGDADESYDFSALMPFIEKLRDGCDLVMGNRFRGGILPGAMPPLHRYFGNPVLTGIGRLFFGSPCGDFHCGLRGFRRDAILALDLRTTGMEFASEMIVKATLGKLRIDEVPTTLSPDGRDRAPHLRSWRDGWRHLRFLLLYSPRWLFFYPGTVLLASGLGLMLWLLPSARTIGTVTLDVHTLLYAAAAALLGYQAIVFGLFTKIFAISEGLLPEDVRLNRVFQFITLETGLAAGLLLLLAGIIGTVCAVFQWNNAAFGPLDYTRTMRLAIPSVLALILGWQTIFASFFLSVLGLRRH